MTLSLRLNQTTENLIRQRLLSHFENLNYPNPSQAVEFSVSVEAAGSRFEYLKSQLPPSFFEQNRAVLISGCSAGSEMLAARQHGLGKIHGTEVDPFYMDICAKRFQGQAGFFPILYGGKNLPYKPESFHLIMSGHIIEHTRDPAFYVKEHLRVLRKDGVFFLEFPSRFHYQELHTSLPSFEWLPEILRNILLRLVAADFSPLREDAKRRFRTILDTKLKQISLGRVRRWVRQSGYQGATLVHVERPAPGIVRCLFKK
jgi:SAM-dependent methyltransferase